MTANENKNPISRSMIDLFRKELHAQLEVLKQGLDELRIENMPEKSNVLFESSRGIKAASQIIKLEPLSRLFESFEELFELAKDGRMVLIPDEITILLEVIDFIQQFEDSPNITNDINLNKQKIENYATTVTLMHKRMLPESKRLELLPPKVVFDLTMQQKGRVKSYSELIDPKDLQNLYHEINEQEPILTDLILKIENHPTEILELASMILQSLKAIKKHANKANIGQLINLIKTVIQFVIVYEQKKMNVEHEDIDLLLKFIDLLKSLKNVNQDELSNWLKINQSEFDKIIVKLNERITACGETLLAIETPTKVSSGIEVDDTMMNLFRIELETQVASLNSGLLELENDPKDKRSLDSLMRSAHSIKGAARVIGLNHIVSLAHAIEDFFVVAQNPMYELMPDQIDICLRGVDILMRLSHVDLHDLNSWLDQHANLINSTIESIRKIVVEPSQHEIILEKPVITSEMFKEAQPNPKKKLIEKEQEFKPRVPEKIPRKTVSQDRFLRVSAQNLNRLMGLAGESVVESRWLQPFVESLIKIKKTEDEVSTQLDFLEEVLLLYGVSEKIENLIDKIQDQVKYCRSEINLRIEDVEQFIRRHSNLSDRLYREVIDSRMRPFKDAVEGFPRMVRDLARLLGKKVKLEIIGKNTPVDRDILEKLETPLSHMLRNAVDHGIEMPEERIKAGKSPEGLIRLEAHHRAGMLAITVSDDGRGLDLDQLRKTIVQKKLATAEFIETLKDHELVDFMFLPGFSTTKKVTEISGRGIGLNTVQNMAQEVGGIVRTTFQLGKGMSFHLQLPLTLSVIRALLVQIGDQPFAFPLSRIDKAIFLPKEEVGIVENRQYFKLQDKNIGIVSANQVLGYPEKSLLEPLAPVVVFSDQNNSYGVKVDKFIGEKELVVQELDSRLGKVADISSGAILEDGSPVLIFDVEDLVRSVDNLLSGGGGRAIASVSEQVVVKKKQKRILVVDDSITVREVESRLLQNHGYAVASAVNGIDALNAIRIAEYDLIITDIDMPRMNGIELVRTIKKDPKLKNLPVMIVSYKDQDEDKMLGLEAGANYYLTKSSFHDESLLGAVWDLIGKA